MFKKKMALPIVSLALFIATPFFALADAKSEIRIDTSGNIVAKNIKVTMIAQPGISKFFYTRALWENVFIRMTVLTDDKTVITKNHGEKAGVFDIKEGDILNIEGHFPMSADTLNIMATNITDLSLEKEEKEISGVVTAISTTSPGFIIKTQRGNIIRVNVGNNTSIVKGARMINQAEVHVGDAVLSIKGTFDYQTYIIEATNIEIHQDMSIFKPKNYSGTLKFISATALPSVFTVTVDGKDYAVYLPGKTIIMNKTRKTIDLTRFVLGDSIRFYGTLRQTDLSAIDVEVVRNMNF